MTFISEKSFSIGQHCAGVFGGFLSLGLYFFCFSSDLQWFAYGSYLTQLNVLCSRLVRNPRCLSSALGGNSKRPICRQIYDIMAATGFYRPLTNKLYIYEMVHNLEQLSDHCPYSTLMTIQTRHRYGLDQCDQSPQRQQFCHAAGGPGAWLAACSIWNRRICTCSNGRAFASMRQSPRAGSE